MAQHLKLARGGRLLGLCRYGRPNGAPVREKSDGVHKAGLGQVLQLGVSEPDPANLGLHRHGADEPVVARRAGHLITQEEKALAIRRPDGSVNPCLVGKLANLTARQIKHKDVALAAHFAVGYESHSRSIGRDRWR